MIKPLYRFDEITDVVKPFVGGKAYALAKMKQAGFNLPNGFVYTENAKVSDVEIVVRELKGKLFAVRSSASAEDSNTTSWAGQLETFLGVAPDDIWERVQKCRASLKSQKSLAYGEQTAQGNLHMGVIVQEMIPSDLFGVMFTKHPVNGSDKIVIEVVAGLGEVMVQGLVTPTRYEINKMSGEILSHELGDQDLRYDTPRRTASPSLEGTSNQTVGLVETEVTEIIQLTKNELREITNLGISLEKFWDQPQDIEWTIQNEQIFVLQSRPITIR